MRKYELKNLCDCTVAQQVDILVIRNGDYIRKFMYTDHIISINEHLGYIEKLKTDKGNRVFAALKDGTKPAGIVSITKIDQQHKKADWAFYLNNEERGGVGTALEIAVLDYVFADLELEKLNCEVLETNPAVVAMHKRFGFVEEGFRRENIEKDGVRIGVHLLGITRAEWQNSRALKIDELSAKIADVKIEFVPEEKNFGMKVIDKIQSARAKNNINWMNLLRLSVEQSEKHSMPIISEIMKLDAEINALTRDLIEKEP